MVKHVGTYTEPTEFLVATEANMMWEMERQHPRHTYLGVPGVTCSCNKCPHMARNTLEKVRDCMRDGKPEITWQPEFDRAKEVLTRSLLNPPRDAGGGPSARGLSRLEVRWSEMASRVELLSRRAAPCRPSFPIVSWFGSSIRVPTPGMHLTPVQKPAIWSIFPSPPG